MSSLNFVTFVFYDQVPHRHREDAVSGLSSSSALYIAPELSQLFHAFYVQIIARSYVSNLAHLQAAVDCLEEGNGERTEVVDEAPYLGDSTCYRNENLGPNISPLQRRNTRP